MLTLPAFKCYDHFNDHHLKIHAVYKTLLGTAVPFFWCSFFGHYIDLFNVHQSHSDAAELLQEIDHFLYKGPFYQLKERPKNIEHKWQQLKNLLQKITPLSASFHTVSESYVEQLRLL